MQSLATVKWRVRIDDMLAVKWTVDLKCSWATPDSSNYVIIHLKQMENVPF